jgi:hypothetical protein
MGRIRQRVAYGERALELHREEVERTSAFHRDQLDREWKRIQEYDRLMRAGFVPGTPDTYRFYVDVDLRQLEMMRYRGVPNKPGGDLIPIEAVVDRVLTEAKARAMRQFLELLGPGGRRVG